MDEKEMMTMTIRQPSAERNLNMSPSIALSFHKDSRSSILKPNIRIIHIFAPKIIKTDTANFRDLVQRLTGKQADRGRRQPSSMKSRGRNNNKQSTTREPRQLWVVAHEEPIPRKAEHFDVFRGLESMERPEVKEEQGGYWKDFADLEDGFMHESRGLSPPHIDAPLRMPYFDTSTPYLRRS